MIAGWLRHLAADPLVLSLSKDGSAPAVTPAGPPPDAGEVTIAGWCANLAANPLVLSLSKDASAPAVTPAGPPPEAGEVTIAGWCATSRPTRLS